MATADHDDITAAIMPQPARRGVCEFCGYQLEGSGRFCTRAHREKAYRRRRGCCQPRPRPEPPTPEVVREEMAAALAALVDREVYEQEADAPAEVTR